MIESVIRVPSSLLVIMIIDNLMHFFKLPKTWGDKPICAAQITIDNDTVKVGRHVRKLQRSTQLLGPDGFFAYDDGTNTYIKGWPLNTRMPEDIQYIPSCSYAYNPSARLVFKLWSAAKFPSHVLHGNVTNIVASHVYNQSVLLRFSETNGCKLDFEKNVLSCKILQEGRILQVVFTDYSNVCVAIKDGTTAIELTPDAPEVQCTPGSILRARSETFLSYIVTCRDGDSYRLQTLMNFGEVATTFVCASTYEMFILSGINATKPWVRSLMSRANIKSARS